MKFYSILKQLILENRDYKFLYNRWVLPSSKALEKNPNAKGFVDFDTFKTIIFADPTTKAPENFDIDGALIDDMELVSVGGNSEWLLKNFVKPPITDEMKTMDPQSKEFKNAIKNYRELYLQDLENKKEQLVHFGKVKQYLPQEQRDINRLTSLDLEKIFRDVKVPEKKQKEIEKAQVKKTREGFKHVGGEIIHNGSDWIVIKVEGNNEASLDAARYYGGYQDYKKGESKWCTSAPGLSNHFESHINKGPLYIIFPQNDNGKVGKRTGLPEERYQFHFESGQFRDRHDSKIDLKNFLFKNAEINKIPEIRRNYAKFFLKSFINKEEVELFYPEMMYLFDFDTFDLDKVFNFLPKNIVKLKFKNISDEDLYLDVPESLSRFSNLHILEFENMCKTLPNSIGKLSELGFLSLPNNKNLVSLPESISNLENLSFINLHNSNPNIKIPESLKEKMLDNGNGLWILSDEDIENEET